MSTGMGVFFGIYPGGPRGAPRPDRGAAPGMEDPWRTFPDAGGPLGPAGRDPAHGVAGAQGEQAALRCWRCWASIIGVSTVIAMVSLINGLTALDGEPDPVVRLEHDLHPQVAPAGDHRPAARSLRNRRAFTLGDRDAILAQCPVGARGLAAQLHRGAARDPLPEAGDEAHVRARHGRRPTRRRTATTCPRAASSPQFEVDHRANVALLGRETLTTLFPHAERGRARRSTSATSRSRSSASSSRAASSWA